jgi:ABC-type phosphate transport system substrate-binding protein
MKDLSMRLRRIPQIFFFLICLITPCLAHHMAVVADKDNKTQNLSSAQLAKIFKGEATKWPDGRNVVVIFHETSTEEMGTLVRLTKMKDSEIRGMIAAHKNTIRKVASDADVIDAVAATPGGVGLVEEHSITDRVTVIKVDGKLPMEEG